MQRNRDFTAEDMELLNPTGSRSIQVALQFIQNPVKMCEHVHSLIQKLNENMQNNDHKAKGKNYFYHFSKGIFLVLFFLYFLLLIWAALI